jgi:hypothetical protein
MQKPIIAWLVAACLLACPMNLAADQKISQLETASPLTGPDEFPINQAGTTKKATLTQVDNYLGVTTHKNDATIHRSINDSASNATSLWSAFKILSELATKADTSHSHDTGDIVSGIFGVLRGGTGLNSISPNKLLYSSSLNTLAELSPGSSVSLSGGTLNVVDNTSTQRVMLTKNGASGGTRRQINLIEGTGLTITASDNPGNDRVDVTLTATTSGYPTGFRGTAPPVYASATTLTHAFIRDRDNADGTNITKGTTTSVDIATTGLNGMAQSATLAGTVAVTNGAASVTGTSTTFTTDYMVGDVICVTTAQCRRITVISSNTGMTVESNFSSTVSGVTYRRGGRAPNTHYLEYSITDGTTAGFLLSTRNVAGGQTLVDLPSGYTASRQQAFSIRLNGSSNMLEFYVADGWPNRPRIFYNTDFVSDATDPTNVLSAGSASSFTSVSLSNYLPPIAQIAVLLTQKNSIGQFYLRPSGSSLTTGVMGYDYDNAVTAELTLKTNAAQSVEYKVGGGNLDMAVRGYIVTEVP